MTEKMNTRLDDLKAIRQNTYMALVAVRIP